MSYFKVDTLCTNPEYVDSDIQSTLIILPVRFLIWDRQPLIFLRAFHPQKHDLH